MLVWFSHIDFARCFHPTSWLDCFLLKMMLGIIYVTVWLCHYIVDQLFYYLLLFNELFSVILCRYIHDVIRCTTILFLAFLAFAGRNFLTILSAIVAVDKSRVPCWHGGLSLFTFSAAVDACMILFDSCLFYQSARLAIGWNDCDIWYLHRNELDLLIFFFRDRIWVVKRLLLLFLWPQGCAREKGWTTKAALSDNIMAMIRDFQTIRSGLLFFLTHKGRGSCWFPKIYPFTLWVLIFVRVGRCLLCCDILFRLSSG